jgi:hypothetical protein
VRALVLEVARPAEWRPLAAVWKGVQEELGLPAPAIAANGADGLQLWFSLAAPLDAAQAHGFLDALRLRYMADVPLHRITMTTTPLSAPAPIRVPAQPLADGRWSVFVAADLAPVFEESPWLDGPPSDEGQAELLGRVDSALAAPFAAAQAQLQVRPEDVPAPGDPAPGDKSHGDHGVAHGAAQHFLLTVMNDAAAPLALRIEAAKALLADG